ACAAGSAPHSTNASAGTRAAAIVPVTATSAPLSRAGRVMRTPGVGGGVRAFSAQSARSRIRGRSGARPCPSITSIMSDVIAGRIELLDPLARGATGSLWRAIDRRYGAICAAKVMRQRDGADVLRFVREQTVGTAQGLGAHPHLLPPYTWVAEDDTVVLVMPLVHGGTLSGAVADHGPLAPTLVAHLLRQLLDALSAMHS